MVLQPLTRRFVSGRLSGFTALPYARQKGVAYQSCPSKTGRVEVAVQDEGQQ